MLGTHIIVSGQLEQGMYYLESPTDKRAVFVMPWKNQIMIGTTEREYSGAPEKATPPEGDIQYLVDIYNYYFTTQISPQDITQTFAGLRVLPRSAGTMFSRPRNTIIHHNNVQQAAVFTLYGGKLTAHRATAQQLVNQINI